MPISLQSTAALAGEIAVNVAVGLRRAGFVVDYFGAVGDDRDGRSMLRALQREGVGTSWVRVFNTSTSITEIRLADGEREFSGFTEGAAELYRLDESDVAELIGRSNVHGVHSENDVALFLRLSDAGVRLTYDFAHYRDLAAVSGLDVAFFSAREDESLEEARELARAAVASGATTSVVMCGSRGSVAYGGSALAHRKAQVIEPVDTCGAGDSYIAAFVAARCGGADLERCMSAGTAAATTTCHSLGMLPIDDDMGGI